MADETDNTQSEEQPQTNPAVEKLEKRNAALIKQINEMRDKLDSIEAAKHDESAQREKEALAAKGDYESAIKLHQQEVAHLKEQMAAQQREHQDSLLRGQLERALLARGATDEIFLEGAIGRYMRMDERPDPGEYVAEVAKTSERYFKHAPPNTGFDGRVDTSRSQNEWEARRQVLRQGLKFGKQPPEALREITEANAKVREHLLKHGTLPDGFSPQE